MMMVCTKKDYTAFGVESRELHFTYETDNLVFYKICMFRHSLCVDSGNSK